VAGSEDVDAVEDVRPEAKEEEEVVVEHAGRRSGVMWYEPGTGPSHTELRRRAESDSVERILHASQRYALLLEATEHEPNPPPQDVEQSQELDRISNDEQYQIKVLLRCKGGQQAGLG
jgi:hypothetical protein